MNLWSQLLSQETSTDGVHNNRQRKIASISIFSLLFSVSLILFDGDRAAVKPKKNGVRAPVADTHGDEVKEQKSFYIYIHIYWNGRELAESTTVLHWRVARHAECRQELSKVTANHQPWDFLSLSLSFDESISLLLLQHSLFASFSFPAALPSRTTDVHFYIAWLAFPPCHSRSNGYEHRPSSN